MSSAQAQPQTKPHTNPTLKAVQAQPETLPDAVHVIGELVEAYLKSKGTPALVADEVSESIEKAAKRVPNWVVYVIFAIGGPLLMGIYAQYQTYKDLPSRMSALETTVESYGETLKDIQTDLKTLTKTPSTKE